ncbi:hypothetical protein XENOCAPTIV_012854 [Xenoophorus captivus]|uniref:Uncharacterized protein n=1 Tax=Xenoophorus captivus TaxID=1517983 RepID=A0ABV0R042_9TELE
MTHQLKKRQNEVMRESREVGTRDSRQAGLSILNVSSIQRFGFTSAHSFQTQEKNAKCGLKSETKLVFKFTPAASNSATPLQMPAALFKYNLNTKCTGACILCRSLIVHVLVETIHSHFTSRVTAKTLLSSPAC